MEISVPGDPSTLDAELFPLTLLFALFQWWHDENIGSSLESNGGCDRCLCVRLWAMRCLLSTLLNPLAPSDRPSSLSLPLMYPKAVSSRAASQQSINTGNAIHLWNITPSLTVSVHHCGHHPHTADREEDNTRQPQLWASIIGCNHRHTSHY